MVKMKICMPFNYMDNYYWKRYYDQIKVLSENCDGLFIPIYGGIYPDNYDELNVEMKIYRDLSNKGKKVINKEFRRKFYQLIYPLRILDKKNKVNKFAKECSKHDYDLVLGYSGGGWIEYLHIALGKYKNVKVVHRMRGYGIRERQFITSLATRLLSEYLDAYAWRHYNYHIPIKQEYYHVISEWGISTRLISNPIGLGIDTNMFKPTNYPDKLTIGYFGRLSPEKNMELLFKIMNETPDINYIVVGKKLMEIDIPNNCDYVGSIHKDRMNKYYNKVNAVILPSLSEGVSNIIYETYATGRLLMCSEKAIPYEYPVFGKKFSFDVKEWVTYLYSLTPDYCKYVGSNGIQWANKYTWNDFGINITKECRKLLK